MRCQKPWRSTMMSSHLFWISIFWLCSWIHRNFLEVSAAYKSVYTVRNLEDGRIGSSRSFPTETPFQQYSDRFLLWGIQKPVKRHLHPWQVHSQAHWSCLGNLWHCFDIVLHFGTPPYDMGETPRSQHLLMEGKNILDLKPVWGTGFFLTCLRALMGPAIV